MMQMFKITSDYFVAGVILANDVVVDAAPIIKYMQTDHWALIKLVEHCRRKGWIMEEIMQVHSGESIHEQDGLKSIRTPVAS